MSTPAAKSIHRSSASQHATTLLLSFGAGGADAFAFILLGGIFTANMTGNLILVGMVGRNAYGHVVIGASFAIVVFALTAWRALRCTRGTPEHVERKSISLLAVGAAAQIAIMVTWSVAHDNAGPQVVLMLICLSAVAMAVQTVVARRMKAPGALTTTFVTGTMVSLLDDVASGRREYVWIRAASIATLVFGALVVAVVVLVAPIAAPLVPALAGLTAYLITLNAHMRTHIQRTAPATVRLDLIPPPPQSATLNPPADTTFDRPPTADDRGHTMTELAGAEHDRPRRGRQPLSSATAFVGVAYAFIVVMMGTTMPAPEYSLYEAQFGFSELIITVIFATYALGVLGALLAFGRWSDAVGRRPMLIAAIIMGILSAVVFVFADSLTTLLIGRVLSGISAGIFVGTATVTLLEMAPEKWRSAAPAVATAANIGGLGLGPLMAGVLVQYLPDPTQVTYVVHALLLVIAALVVYRAPETVVVAPGVRPRLQWLSVPSAVRSDFIRASVAGFAGFAVMGLFSAISPGFVAGVLGISNHAVTGAVVFVVFASSALAQGVLRGRNHLTAQRRGCVVLVVGVAVLALSLWVSSLTLLLAAAIVCGTGQGFIFKSGIASITSELPQHGRADVTSAFFVVVYIALSLPVIGAGALATQSGLITAGIVFAAVVALLATFAFVLLTVESRNRHRVPRHAVSSDSTPSGPFAGSSVWFESDD